jgi:hypothetical protein
VLRGREQECESERGRRRRSLLRIVHARGAIPNEMGPTRWERKRERQRERGSEELLSSKKPDSD